MKKIGFILIVLAWLINSCIDYFHNDVLQARIFFMILAVAILCIVYESRSQSKFYESIYRLSIGNIIKELMWRGSVIDWYEILIGIGVIVYVYNKEKIKNSFSNVYKFINRV